MIHAPTSGPMCEQTAWINIRGLHARRGNALQPVPIGNLYIPLTTASPGVSRPRRRQRHNPRADSARKTTFPSFGPPSVRLSAERKSSRQYHHCRSRIWIVRIGVRLHSILTIRCRRANRRPSVPATPSRKSGLKARIAVKNALLVIWPGSPEGRSLGHCRPVREGRRAYRNGSSSQLG